MYVDTMLNGLHCMYIYTVANFKFVYAFCYKRAEHKSLSYKMASFVFDN